jgi:hypothetical protein
MSESSNPYTTDDQLQGLIEQLDAYISQYHGGTVELVSFDGKVVKCIWADRAKTARSRPLPCTVG